MSAALRPGWFLNRGAVLVQEISRFYENCWRLGLLGLGTVLETGTVGTGMVELGMGKMSQNWGKGTG